MEKLGLMLEPGRQLSEEEARGYTPPLVCSTDFLWHRPEGRSGGSWERQIVRVRNVARNVKIEMSIVKAKEEGDGGKYFSFGSNSKSKSNISGSSKSF